MQYPDDATLLARGKHATLSKERYTQIKRMQDICTQLVTSAQAVLKDCQEMPPVNAGPMATVETCVANMQDARERIVKLAGEMIDLKPSAWS